MPGDYETFENIYLDLSRQPGKCRFAASGMGWKPSGGDTWTLQNTEISNAQWSRAARGYEVKIFTRTMGIVQLDGFEADVRYNPFGLIFFLALFGPDPTPEDCQKLVFFFFLMVGWQLIWAICYRISTESKTL